MQAFRRRAPHDTPSCQAAGEIFEGFNGLVLGLFKHLGRFETPNSLRLGLSGLGRLYWSSIFIRYIYIYIHISMYVSVYLIMRACLFDF